MDRLGGDLVGLSVDLPALDSTPGEGDRVRARVVIPSAVVADLRRSAELGEEDDQGLIEQATFVEIGQQGRGAAVEDRQHGVLEPVEAIAVGIPVVALGAVEVSGRADHGSQGHSRLDEPSRQQHALAADMFAIGAMDLFRFFLQLEGFLDLRIFEHIDSQAAGVVKLVSSLAPGKTRFETTEEAEAFLQPVFSCRQGGIDIGGAETTGNSSEGLAVLRRDHDGVVFHSQPAAVLTGLEGAVVHQWIGQANRRRQASGSLAELGDDRAHRWPVIGRWRQVSRQGALRRRASCHIPVHGPAVSGASMVHRAHNGELLCMPGDLRHVFGNLDSGGRGRDRLELAANFLRRVRLRIPAVELADAAPAEQYDTGLRPADSCSLGGLELPQAEKIR